MGKAIDILETQETTPLLEQLAGEGRGRVFELAIDDIRLGREEENDIVINDDSVSRFHAKIEKRQNGEFVITDNDSKNGVVVNKEKVTSCKLSDGDIIQLGHFVFRFRVPDVGAANMPVPRVRGEKVPGLDSMTPPPKKDRKRIALYGGLIIFVGVAYLMNNNSSTSSKEDAKPTQEITEKFKPSALPELSEQSNSGSMAGLEDPLIKTEKEISNLENKDSHVKEAELYFRKGQRDYFNKNYHQAIDNFDAAISLWAQHPLASYYRGLAAHESEVEAEKNREIGLKYFNSLQYERSIYHFKAAIDNLSHIKSDNVEGKRVIQECERYIDFARRKLRAAELVP